SISPATVRDLIADRWEEDVRRAVAATIRTRPDDLIKYFTAALGAKVSSGRAGQSGRAVPRLQSIEDPYA
ncbi:MAG: hypothetical protein ACE5FJ_11105, partial [Gemmatimonadales bacterium]